MQRNFIEETKELNLRERDRVYRFSEKYSNAAYNIKMREQKAKKILAVLDDYYSGNLKNLTLLDIGCSVGIISNMLSKRFAEVAGIDVDEQAIKYAQANYNSENMEFRIGSGINLDFPDKTFDVVVCSHIYEHVPDAKSLLYEIYRVLKTKGVCYFAAGNRLSLIEPHYKLPLLSIMPKYFANLYLRILKKGDVYCENHLTSWRLKRLVSRFEIMDYTLKIIQDPHKYRLTEMIKHNSFKQKIALWVLKKVYWLCPTYIWLLRKNER